MSARTVSTILPICPLLRLRGRAGVGARDQPCGLQMYPVFLCPHPNLPPQAGGRGMSMRAAPPLTLPIGRGRIPPMIVRAVPTDLAIRSLPRMRGRAGVGARDQPCGLQMYPVFGCPHPNLPPHAGEGVRP